MGNMRKKITILKMMIMAAMIMRRRTDLNMSLTQLTIINCWLINLII